MPEEPADNISGGANGGGRTTFFEPSTAQTRAEAVVDQLGGLYWQKAYGGRDAFECLVRTILSQNTSDKASQPAHDALIDCYGSHSESEPDLVLALAEADQSTLAETISGAGLYNQKSAVIIAAAEEIHAEFETAAAFDAFVTDESPSTVRTRLLEIHGVGPKTADCVLLFAGGRGGVFPNDHELYVHTMVT